MLSHSVLLLIRGIFNRYGSSYGRPAVSFLNIRCKTKRCNRQHCGFLVCRSFLNKLFSWKFSADSGCCRRHLVVVATCNRLPVQGIRKDVWKGSSIRRPSHGLAHGDCNHGWHKHCKCNQSDGLISIHPNYDDTRFAPVIVQLYMDKYSKSIQF